MAIFTDIDFVTIEEAEPPDAYSILFDVIYAGETWCRSRVDLDASMAALLSRENRAMVAAARDALLELLAPQALPVSFHLRVTPEGTTVLAQASPGV